MDGYGRRPVDEGAKGILWAATLCDDGLSGMQAFSLMVRLHRGR
jgi:hypothetical protein